MPAVAETPTAAAPADWRARERLRQNTADELHRAAAIDLASSEGLWGQLPTDGPVDELLSLRHPSEVPSIDLSRAAASLAVWGCIAEMAARREQVGWSDDSLRPLIACLASEVPHLAKASLLPLAGSLPRLKEAAAVLEGVSDAELAHVTGRTHECGTSTGTTMIFREAPGRFMADRSVALWDS